MRFLFLLLIIPFVAKTQTKIDSSFKFQTDPAKKYSLYIPPGYKPSVPVKVLVGLHPFNPARWNAKSWRDTLTFVAQHKNLLLICPDGGTDGNINDAIDTAFTSALIDSVKQWYNVDNDRMYLTGFSRGGEGTYIYGLNHVHKFGGFMPIGAAINGVNPLLNIKQHAANKAFYVIHGGNDFAHVSFTPVVDLIEQEGAIVKRRLLSGVGHTIDFANHRMEMYNGFEWIDSVNNYQLNNVPTAIELSETSSLVLNYVGNNVYKNLSKNQLQVNVYGINGTVIINKSLQSNYSLDLNELKPGMYLLQMTNGSQFKSVKIVIQ